MVYRESLWVQYAHVLRAGQDNLKLELAVILDFCSEFDFEDGDDDVARRIGIRFRNEENIFRINPRIFDNLG